MSEHLRRTAGLLALAAVPLLAGCGGAPGDDTIRFRATQRLSSVISHIAAAEGFFEREGLDVEMVFWESGSTLLPLLDDGSLDVSEVNGLLGVANLADRGARLRIVAGRVFHDTSAPCGYFSFVARRGLVESGRLDDFASLRGLRICTSRTTSSYFYWSRALASAGLDLGDVELLDVPRTAVLDALAEDRIDVCSGSEPWPTRWRQSGAASIWRPLADALPDRVANHLVFGRRLLEDRPDLGYRFMRAYRSAAVHYQSEGKSEEHLDIVARRTRIDREDLAEMCWPSVPPDGLPGRADLEDWQRWGVEEGLLDRVVPYEKRVDERFLADANSGIAASASPTR